MKHVAVGARARRVFVLSALLAGLSSAQVRGEESARPLFDTVPPQQAGLDEAKLAEFDALMEKEVEAGRIVGSLALVSRGKQVAYTRTWGLRSRTQEQPMTADTIFRIYSMSKPITSVAAMQLVEQGKLDLDDPLSKHLPSLGGLKVLEGEQQVDAEREITVRDLLRHTSGLTYGFFGDTPVDKAYRKAGILFTDTTIESTVEKVSRVPLLHQPGTRWNYSISTDVLGRLVEVVSGERFDEYLKSHIFRPLGMEDSFFVVPEAKQDRLAQMFSPDGNGGLKAASPWESIRFTSSANRFFSGGGGLCSTTKDYLRFCQSLLAGGELEGKRVLKPETLAQMTRDQLPPGAGRRGFKFGLGFSIGPEGEYSWGGAAGTRFWINPRRKLISIYMVQVKPTGRDYGKRFKSLVYAADQAALQPAGTP